MTDFNLLTYYSAEGNAESNPKHVQADLCIFGGTPAGIVAAVQASRMGLRAVIAEFGMHLGGMSASGLGRTDIGSEEAIGGLSRAFYRTLGKHYGSRESDGAAWAFEPHIAERIFTEWVQDAAVPVYYKQHLDKVDMQNGRITRITMENGNTFSASIFIDATYEGDLLARAGISYHVGRESNSLYKETLNGIHFGHPKHNFYTWVDPYRIEGKPDSGLLPGVSDAEPGFQGQGDKCVQAYNFRICLTNVPDNQIPFPQPSHYDPGRFALMARYIRSGVWDALKLNVMMPRGKTDLNNRGGFSTDHIGGNYDWPDGDYATRERIYQDHVNYNLGLLYFLSNDDSIPARIRGEMRQWGLPADEFLDTNGWPHQLYVREARRMVSEVVMTERHCRKIEKVTDSIGLAAYTMDSHNCRRIVLDGRCVNEGNVEISPTGAYPISYRAIVPRGEECSNLLVPVCLSSSHIAYGSIRMEPIFMILGQSAATAAALAIEQGCAVQDVDYEVLRERLELDGQIIQV
ncbi:FAD-dependent oxidoreductase [Paenibacillus sp. LMG 31458]|uniref:FAD-dependent oxidoreductase n=1 Tax=Paenibacillus phytorum TaxID=2654977 RepID=A0ABX1XUT4_9BACL|nr:FAD-dependent oxidoreductase [Paenibacillus phytorum]NOU71588.1 FAD-dependent oxidoreductase [Paenibacillus phytorum]